MKLKKWLVAAMAAAMLVTATGHDAKACGIFGVFCEDGGGGGGGSGSWWGNLWHNTTTWFSNNFSSGDFAHGVSTWNQAPGQAMANNFAHGLSDAQLNQARNMARQRDSEGAAAHYGGLIP